MDAFTPGDRAAFEVLPASASEVTRIVPVVGALARTQPELVVRCQMLAADRGLDKDLVDLRMLEQESE